MNRLKIDSSSIHSMGWDETGSEVQFHAKGCATEKKGKAVALESPATLEGRCDCAGGEVYHYPGVPEELHNAVMASPSIGQAFARSIKGARHPHTKAILYPHVKREAAKA